MGRACLRKCAYESFFSTKLLFCGVRTYALRRASSRGTARYWSCVYPARAHSLALFSAGSSRELALGELFFNLFEQVFGDVFIGSEEGTRGVVPDAELSFAHFVGIARLCDEVIFLTES